VARFLFVPVPVAGHVAPALALARGAVARGHDVSIYSGRRFQQAVERIGARFVPFRTAPDLELERLNELFPERPQKPGVAQAKWDLKRLVIDLAAEQFEDLSAIVRDASPAIVVADVTAIAGTLVARHNNLPLALLNPLNLFLPSRDTFPDGFGVAPSTTTLGRLRNRFANWVIFEKILGDVNQHLYRLLDRLEVPLVRAPLMALPGLVSDLILQPTVPEFEYPRSDLPPHLHFIGALLPQGPTDWNEPSWWPRLHGDRPVVLVTQGTIATNFDDLIRPTLAALDGEDVLVVATTGRRNAEPLAVSQENTVVDPFVPFDRVMPHVDVMVTNGGYGGIHFALAHGVPLVVAGQSEDKAETCARVGWSGVGINLKTHRATADQVRRAVREVLQNPNYRARARTLQTALNQCDGPTRGTELLERLATTHTKVLREDQPPSR
jgi:MGT family glycosyltransferase